MSYNTEKAGNSLPQNCPELELFIKAQAHIRAAALIFDGFTEHPLPHLPAETRRSFLDLAAEMQELCYSALGGVEALQFRFFAPLYSIDYPMEDELSGE